MVRAKSSTRKSNTLSDKDRYTAELSTGQLVIGVCILLMFGLACFLMGVVIGKFDPTLSPQAALDPQPVEQAATQLADTDVTPVTRPAEVIARETPAAPPPEMRVPMETAKKTEPAAQPVASSTPPEDSSTSKDEEVETGKAVEVKAPEPVKLAEVPAAEPETKVQVAVAQPAVSTEPRYGVQIAAFGSRERAEVSKRDLESKTSYTAQIYTSKDGRLVRVVVGSYADKMSAGTARDDLKRNHGFSDCWVVNH